MIRQVCGMLLVGLVLGADAKDDATRKDLAQLQGTWVLLSVERDDKKIPAEEARKTKQTITGKQFRFLAGPGVGTSADGTFVIDASKKPKTLDKTATTGPNKGKVFLGIYDIEGDVHRVCFAPAGQERPKEFAAKAGTGHIYQVWKREQK